MALHTDGKAPLLKATPTQLIVHGDVKRVAAEQPRLCSSVQTLMCNDVLPVKHARAIVVTQLYERSQPMSLSFSLNNTTLNQR